MTHTPTKNSATLKAIEERLNATPELHEPNFTFGQRAYILRIVKEAMDTRAPERGEGQEEKTGLKREGHPVWDMVDRASEGCPDWVLTRGQGQSSSTKENKETGIDWWGEYDPAMNIGGVKYITTYEFDAICEWAAQIALSRQSAVGGDWESKIRAIGDSLRSVHPDSARVVSEFEVRIRPVIAALRCATRTPEGRKVMSKTCTMFPRNMGIDHCIGELVEKMNEAGLETSASCCGHGFQPTRISLKNGAEILVLNYDQAQRVAKLFPDTNGMTRHRGHAICPTGFIYEDTGEPVSDNPDRACGYCDLANTPEGHDGCLGTLPGVMNACCGHGNPDEAYVQYDNGDRIGGAEALYAALQMKAESTTPPLPTPATGGCNCHAVARQITVEDVEKVTNQVYEECAHSSMPLNEVLIMVDTRLATLIERAGEEGE